jgi:hypothetical protein
MYKKEYQDGGRMQAPQGMEEGVAQLKAMKQAYDQAVENKDMETIGKIESLVMEMFQSTEDPRVKEALSMMFPTMDAMMERPEGEPPEMPHGGVMSPMRKKGVPTNNTSTLELEKQKASSLPFVKDDSYLSLPDEYEAKKLLTEMGYKGRPEMAPEEMKAILVDALENYYLGAHREGVPHHYSFKHTRNKAQGGYVKMK